MAVKRRQNATSDDVHHMALPGSLTWPDAPGPRDMRRTLSTSVLRIPTRKTSRFWKAFEYVLFGSCSHVVRMLKACASYETCKPVRCVRDVRTPDCRHLTKYT